MNRTQAIIIAILVAVVGVWGLHGLVEHVLAALTNMEML